MDAQQIAVTIGAALGSASASFLAAWVGFVKPERSHREEAQDRQTALEKDVENLQEKLVDFEQRTVADKEEQSRRFGRYEKRLAQQEDHLRHTVTDEAFMAHTQETTKSINGLSEKVGRATGALEAWRDAANARKG